LDKKRERRREQTVIVGPVTNVFDRRREQTVIVGPVTNVFDLSYVNLF